MSRTVAALALWAVATFSATVPQRITLRDGVFRAQPATAGATLQVHVDGPGELPALFGASSLEQGAVLFKPRFPLEPGLRYRAVFRESPGAAPLVELFTIPKDPVGPPTRIERIDPTGERVPENLLKLYLSFSAPMRRGEAYRFIRLLDDGEGGRKVELPFLEIEQELWDREARRLTLLFDPGRVKRDLLPHDESGTPLRSGGSYTLVVDRGFPDAFGNPLEAEARRTFRVGPPDYDPPRTSDWRLALPKVGARDPLVTTFPEPLDRALLERVIEVIGPAGEMVRGLVSIEENEKRWTFTPSGPWVAGVYGLRVLSILEDLAGNSLGRPFEVRSAEERAGQVPRTFEVLPFKIE